MSLEERLYKLEHIYVASPRINGILKEIENCRVDSKVAREPRSMLLIGETGAGKTTIIEKYLEKFPAFDTDERKVIPVFKSELPSKITPRALAQTMLSEMGDPDPDSGNEVALTRRLVKLIKETGVELIIIDEFQHLLKPDCKKYMDFVSNWIKSLLNNAKVPILLAGTPDSESILATNAQLETRISLVEELKYYSWAEEPDRIEYRQFLKMVDKALPFEKPANLQDPDRAIRFFAASVGMPRHTMRLILESGRIALKGGLPGLTDELFEDAFNKHLLRSSKLKKNPWKMSKDELERYIEWQAKQKSSSREPTVSKSTSGSSLAGARQ